MADKPAPSLADLIKAREELEQQINLIRVANRNKALEMIATLIAENNLTQQDIFPKPTREMKKEAQGEKQPKSTKGVKLAPLFRDPVTGKEWTGRGRSPKWMEGKDPEQFRIPPQV